MPVKEKVFIVEMRMENGKWKPTSGAGLTSTDANIAARLWRARNPYVRFRVSKYVRESKD